MCIKMQEYDGNIIAVMILIIQHLKYSERVNEKFNYKELIRLTVKFSEQLII